jgi:hypothetical protein
MVRKINYFYLFIYLTGWLFLTGRLDFDHAESNFDLLGGGHCKG